jgi:PST family polysaccharide transporter
MANATGQGGQLFLTLCYNALLARLISPHDFGLVAMALVATSFLQVFKDAGLSTATIQREDITNAQVSNLFWINVAAGTVAMLAMAGVAPLIAWFFKQPGLIDASLALSTSFLMEGLVVQHVAILNRQMRFKVLAAVELSCTAGGFAVGIGMALAGFGYWSLVGAALSTGAFRVASVWTLSRWRPRRPVRGSGTRKLVRFGADLTMVGLVYSLSRNCDTLLVGRYLGSDALGLYSRATVLLMRPLERAIAPIYAVIVPALSRLQNEPVRYRSAFVCVYEGLAIAAFILSALLFPLSDLLVEVILGADWRAAVPIFAALTLALIYMSLAVSTSWLCTSQGRGRDLLLIACIGAVIMITAFLAGLPFGPAGVAVAYSAANLLLTLPVTFYIAGRTGPVTSRDLWFAAIHHVPVFVSVLAATWLAHDWLVGTAPLFVRLVLCLAIGSSAGLATVWWSPKSRRVVDALMSHLNEFRGHHASGLRADVDPSAS